MPLPVADAELRHQNGRLVCDELAALAWPERKVTIAAAVWQDWFSSFSEQGWQIMALADVVDNIEKLEQSLQAKE